MTLIHEELWFVCSFLPKNGAATLHPGMPGIGCFMDDLTLALLRDPEAMESKAFSASQSWDPGEARYQAPRRRLAAVFSGELGLKGGESGSEKWKTLRGWLDCVFVLLLSFVLPPWSWMCGVSCHPIPITEASEKTKDEFWCR